MGIDWLYTLGSVSKHCQAKARYSIWRADSGIVGSWVLFEGLEVVLGLSWIDVWERMREEDVSSPVEVFEIEWPR